MNKIIMLFVVPTLLFAQITTDSVEFNKDMNRKIELNQSLNLVIYSMLFSNGEGNGYVGAEYKNKSIYSIGFEFGPGLVFNNINLKLSLNCFWKRVEMDVQTVSAPPWPPAVHEIRNYNIFGIIPSCGYNFKILSRFTINPQVGINLRFSTLLPSVFLSPSVSFYYHKFGIVTLFNYNFVNPVWVDEKYSYFIGIGYLVNHINLN
jgi:hypothetical protein